MPIGHRAVDRLKEAEKFLIRVGIALLMTAKRTGRELIFSLIISLEAIIRAKK